MAEVEQGVYAKLSKYEDGWIAGEAWLVTDTWYEAVPGYVANRIYPTISPKNAAFPYLVYFKVSDPSLHAMKNDLTIARPRVQVSTWSTSYSEAKAIALQIRIALQDFSGSTGGITFKRIFFDNEYDLPEVDLKAKKIYHHIAQDFIAWHI